MSHIRHLAVLASLVLLLGGVHSASAISIRHDVAEQDYFDLAAPYDAVGRIVAGGFFGSGTLLSPTKFLTAAHVVDSDRDLVLDTALSNISVSFGDDIDATGSPDYYSITAIESVSIASGWLGGDRTFDLAMVTFSTPFLDVAGMNLSTDDPLGMVSTMVGYGVHGTGTAFNNDFDRKRRAANNMIDHEDPDL